MAVNDQDVSESSLEHVMECISAAVAASNDNTEVRLTLRRPRGTVAVEFANGVVIAARPGTHICNLALDAHCCDSIEYSCRNGACGTCEQIMTVVKTKTVDSSLSSSDGVTGSSDNTESSSRYVRPCVATVPNCNSSNGEAIDRIRIVPSNRFAS